MTTAKKLVMTKIRLKS